MNADTPGKHDQVLAQLVVNLQLVAMQQLGKLQDPRSGETDRDLEQARGTIDILEMLKVKCRTGTPEDLVRLLDQVVMDLQMNYMDELRKGDGEDGGDGEAAGAEAGGDPDAPDADASGAEPDPCGS